MCKRLIILILLLSLSFSASADVHRWVDATACGWPPTADPRDWTIGNNWHDGACNPVGMPGAGDEAWVPMQNYYRHDTGMADRLTSMTQHLAYNQIEFDYLWDENIMKLQTGDNRIVGPFGRLYHSIVIPFGARHDDCRMQKVSALAKDAPDRIVFSGEQEAIFPFTKSISDFEAFIAQCRSENPDRWQLKLPDGKKIQVDPPMPSWNKLGWADYTGFMRYKAAFSWKSAATKAMFCLGHVNYAASVLFDGMNIGDCLFTPFQITVDNLEKGTHTLEVDVLNTSANAVFGSPEKIAELTEKQAFKGTYAPIYKELDMDKLRSGLFGPVTLIPELE